MQLERVCFGGGFDLRLTVDGTYAEIRIAGPLTVTTGDESITFDLANAAWTDLAPLSALPRSGFVVAKRRRWVHSSSRSTVSVRYLSLRKRVTKLGRCRRTVRS
jgi:hypothetical protein